MALQPHLGREICEVFQGNVVIYNGAPSLHTGCRIGDKSTSGTPVSSVLIWVDLHLGGFRRSDSVAAPVG